MGVLMANESLALNALKQVQDRIQTNIEREKDKFLKEAHGAGFNPKQSEFLWKNFSNKAPQIYKDFMKKYF